MYKYSSNATTGNILSRYSHVLPSVESSIGPEGEKSTSKQKSYALRTNIGGCLSVERFYYINFQ